MSQKLDKIDEFAFADDAHLCLLQIEFTRIQDECMDVDMAADNISGEAVVKEVVIESVAIIEPPEAIANIEEDVQRMEGLIIQIPDVPISTDGSVKRDLAALEEDDNEKRLVFLLIL